MALRRRSFFRRYFKTGYIPTALDFVDIADSFLNNQTTKPQKMLSDLDMTGHKIDVNKFISSGVLVTNIFQQSAINLRGSAESVYTSALYLSVGTAQPQTTALAGLTNVFNVVTTVGTSVQNIQLLDMKPGDCWTVYNQRDLTLGIQGQRNQQIDALATLVSYTMPARSTRGFVQITSSQILSRTL